MKRFFVDCRDHANNKCSGAFFADTKEELLELVVHHRVKVHKKRDSRRLREIVIRDIREAPPLLRLYRL